MENIKSALSCLPCFPRPPSPNIEDQNTGRDELEGLLGDADDAVDALSLHSSIGRRRGKSGKPKGKKKAFWGISGRNQKSGGRKSVQLLGYHLFGRPVALEEETSSDDEDEETPGTTIGAASSSSLQAHSTLDSISDATPIEDSTIARLGDQTQDQWKPPQTEEDLEREERELAEAEEAAAGLLGVRDLSNSRQDTNSPKLQQGQDEGPPPTDVLDSETAAADNNPPQTQPAEVETKTSTPSDDERAARHAKEIRRAIRAQRKRIKQAAEADAEAAAGGFDLGRQPLLHKDASDFEGFQGSSETGVIVLPPHLTSSHNDDEYGPFVHYEGSVTTTTESVSSSSRTRSRSHQLLSTQIGEPAHTDNLAPIHDFVSDDDHDSTDYGLEYAVRSRPNPRERGSASGSTHSNSISGANRSDGSRRPSRPKGSSRTRSGLVSGYPLPPSSTGSQPLGQFGHRNEPLDTNHVTLPGSPDMYAHHYAEQHPLYLPSSDSAVTKSRKSRSKTSSKPPRSDGSVYSQPGYAPPPPDYSTNSPRTLTHSMLSQLPPSNAKFEGIPGGELSTLQNGGHPLEAEFEGIPGGF